MARTEIKAGLELIDLNVGEMKKAPEIIQDIMISQIVHGIVPYRMVEIAVNKHPEYFHIPRMVEPKEEVKEETEEEYMKRVQLARDRWGDISQLGQINTVVSFNESHVKKIKYWGSLSDEEIIRLFDWLGNK